jgi:flagellar biosynthetic protein FliP
MTDQTVSPPIGTEHVHQHSVGRAIWHFIRHYLEMVAAMLVGMFALGALEDLGWPALTTRADVAAMVMATNMSLGMAAWMRFRGHSWRGITEMSASMYLPFAVLLVPYWAGLAGEGVLMTWGHVLMLPAMALVMLLRPAEYTH